MYYFEMDRVYSNILSLNLLGSVPALRADYMFNKSPVQLKLGVLKFLKG